jgi:hypothetical protein
MHIISPNREEKDTVSRFSFSPICNVVYELGWFNVQEMALSAVKEEKQSCLLAIRF